MGLFNKLFGSETKGQHSEMEHPHDTGTSTTAIDPICGMKVDINKAAAKTDYQGKTYYFCAPGCKTEFDRNPSEYTSKQASGHHSHGHGR